MLSRPCRHAVPLRQLTPGVKSWLCVRVPRCDRTRSRLRVPDLLLGARNDDYVHFDSPRSTFSRLLARVVLASRHIHGTRRSSRPCGTRRAAAILAPACPPRAAVRRSPPRERVSRVVRRGQDPVTHDQALAGSLRSAPSARARRRMGGRRSPPWHRATRRVRGTPRRTP